MSTIIKSKLSKKNEYWINPDRYHELKHFCMQYPMWKSAYEHLSRFTPTSSVIKCANDIHSSSNITEKIAKQMLYYSERMDMVKECAAETDSKLKDYILAGVISGASYDKLVIEFDIPCSRAEYYKLYRRFFYILNKKHY